MNTYHASLVGAPAYGWPDLWHEVQDTLKKKKYARGTLLLYRQVLRGLARTARSTPEAIGQEHIDRYLYRLAYRPVSASWIAMNISVLRTVFDKLHGRSLLRDRRGPRRPYHLPYFLSPDEAGRLLAVAACPRDALLCCPCSTVAVSNPARLSGCTGAMPTSSAVY